MCKKHAKGPGDCYVQELLPYTTSINIYAFSNPIWSLELKSFHSNFMGYKLV